MNMKPFDLEAAKAGKPLISRTGKPIERVFFPLPDSIGFRFVAQHSDGEIRFHNTDGTYDSSPCTHDLFMAPEKKTVWVNIYKDLPALIRACDSKEEADAEAKIESGRLLARVSFEYTEGQGL